MKIHPSLAMFNPLPLSGIACLSLALACASALEPAAPTEVANPALRPAADDDPAFVHLFDGESLAGWKGDERFWSVDAGSILAHTTEDNRPQANTFLIWEGGELRDFELVLEYKIESPAANSGIQIRSENLGDFVVRGYQPDIATAPHITGTFYEERGRGTLAQRGERLRIDEQGRTETETFADADELTNAYDQSEWTEFRIRAIGPHFLTWINGVLMTDVFDRAPEARADGILALQLHAGSPMTMRFRNIRLKALGEDGKEECP